MHKGFLNMYSTSLAGRVLRGMLYALVIMLPLLAWIASGKC
ncbi:MAG TPA: hypothetical protein VK569_05490 [Bacteroidota bacterium]|nr:hypothetical protein [Bacteroidota bacterium]